MCICVFLMRIWDFGYSLGLLERYGSVPPHTVLDKTNLKVYYV